MDRELEKIIEEEKEDGGYEVRNGLVGCSVCGNPAQESFTKAVGWLACGPCATGEADSFDPGDLIPVD